MTELRMEYQLPDEVRARLGALVREYEAILASRYSEALPAGPYRAGLPA